MGEETVKRVLRNLDLTEKEAEAYIFVSKHGVLKCGEIAKGMKKHKAQIYRILKILQTKGLVEPTLEAPARFTAVPFETVLDLSIKAKRDEASQMEITKNEVLNYWKSIHQPRIETSLEKFVVIEGNNKIYPKISQMIKETKKHLSAIATVPGLLRADQYGILDMIFTHPLKSAIKFKFLTDVSKQNLNAMKTLLKKVPNASVNIRGRSPDSGLQLTPRMVIRDDEEALFFITHRPGASDTGQAEVSLWTDCKELVHAFSGIFDEMWHNASDIQEGITATESRKKPEAFLIDDEEKAKQKYLEVLRSADKEIILVTSSRGLLDLSQKAPLLHEVVQRGVSIRIMAPIVDENQNAARQLSEFSQIRHTAFGDLGTTIIDEKHLFQFKDIQIDQDVSKPLHLDNMYYSDDVQYVSKMKMRMEDIWGKAPLPAYTQWEPDFGPLTDHFSFSISGPNPRKAEGQLGAKRISEKEVDEDQSHIPPMEFVQERIIHYERTKEPIIAYGWMARAIIRLPSFPKTPLIGITFIHLDDKSAFGGGGFLTVDLWQETPLGNSFVPVALMVNRQGAMVMQPMYKGTPAFRNIVLIEPHRQLEVVRKDNTLFVGWTVDIPLPPSEYTLGPSCIFFEGHGPAQQKNRSSFLPSGFKSEIDYKDTHAFVTFMNQSTPYVTTGIQGHLITEYLMKTTKP